MDGLPFVTGAIRHRPRDVAVQMRQRERPRKDRPGSGSGGGKSSNDSKDAAARKLTSQMKKAKSAKELLDLLGGVVDGPIFNRYHASAAYRSLTTWKRKGGLTPSDKESPVLPRLAARVQDMALKGQLPPRELSNVFWSLGQLSDDLGISKGLLMALVESMSEKASGMNAQDTSNNLLACVQLKVVAPEVLAALPELAAQISIEAKDMVPQHLSNCLWAATRLKDDAPEVLQMVPAVVEEIPGKQTDFTSQAICNCLEALILLQDSVPAVGDFLAAALSSKNDFLQVTASRVSTLLPTLKGNDLKLAVPGVVWACARVNFYHEELLGSVAQKSGDTLQSLTDWSLCALLWSYDVLDPNARFAEFRDRLESERVRRGLSDSDVSESALGYFAWNRAKALETTR